MADKHGTTWSPSLVPRERHSEATVSYHCPTIRMTQRTEETRANEQREFSNKAGRNVN